jgi:hypothetical protein
MKRANQVMAGLASESLLSSQREGILCKPFLKKDYLLMRFLFVHMFQETYAGSTDAVKKDFEPL